MKKKINEIESLTAKLEKLIQTLDTELADPALYEKPLPKPLRKSRSVAKPLPGYRMQKSNG